VMMMMMVMANGRRRQGRRRDGARYAGGNFKLENHSCIQETTPLPFRPPPEALSHK
jgi:hypothetical protein